jgi:GNAT superfamily N-acetyltransferase
VTDDPVIRPALAADLAQVLDLLDELREGATPGVPWDRADAERADEIWEAIISNPDRHFLVAEVDGAVVGTADVLIVLNLTHGAQPLAFVENVVVTAPRRGRGIGRALMESAMERAKAAGCYRIQFLSNKDRTRAHAFYRRLGFEPSSEGFRLYF